MLSDGGLNPGLRTPVALNLISTYMVLEKTGPPDHMVPLMKCSSFREEEFRCEVTSSGLVFVFQSFHFI